MEQVKCEQAQKEWSHVLLLCLLFWCWCVYCSWMLRPFQYCWICFTTGLHQSYFRFLCTFAMFFYKTSCICYTCVTKKIMVCLILCIFAKLMGQIWYRLLEGGNKNKQILHISVFDSGKPFSWNSKQIYDFLLHCFNICIFFFFSLTFDFFFFK